MPTNRKNTKTSTYHTPAQQGIRAGRAEAQAAARAQARPVRNWPAAQEFDATAGQVQEALEAALETVRALRFDDRSVRGYRTDADVTAIGDLMGYMQLFCEAARRLDGGTLERKILLKR